MVLFFVMQEYDEQLRELSRIMELLDKDSQALNQNAIQLVKNLEERAQKYSLPIQPKLALVRGTLLCGYQEEKQGQLNRKEKAAAKKSFIVNQLSIAVSCIEEYFQTARKQFEECEKLCGQIIMHAYSKGLHKETQDLFSLVAVDVELSPHLANVIALIGSVNARVIFEQAKRAVNQLV